MKTQSKIVQILMFNDSGLLKMIVIPYSGTLASYTILASDGFNPACI